ncbi:hypothetical protein [Terasakiella pusilla]|uniref:hypothetical protein n=1 Tax=Terasakiella pusilla TaxID=64973 RepID=UPI003AA7E153
MIDDYKNYLSTIAICLKKINMFMTKNEDYCAEFTREDGWKLFFEVERYYRPLGEISVQAPNKKKIALHLLMNAYERSEHVSLPPPSLIVQMYFFTANIDGWLKDWGKKDTPQL